MILADTDVLVDFLEGLDPGASRVQVELEHGQLFTTAVNRFELLSAASSARQSRLIRQLLDAMPCLPIDQATADQAAEVYRGFVQRDLPVSMNSCLIATVAIAQKALLMTHQRDSFSHFADLALASLPKDD